MTELYVAQQAQRSEPHSLSLEPQTHQCVIFRINHIYAVFCISLFTKYAYITERGEKLIYLHGMNTYCILE